MRKQSHEAGVHVILSARVQKILAQDVRQRRHIEACGLLIGKIDAQGNWEVEHIEPLRNIFNSPVYFEFAPEDLLMAELDYPDHIIGAYHSHPTGFARASNTDRENMQRVNVEEHIPWLWLIISGPFDEQFTITEKGSVAGTSIVAYHHYEKAGLMKIPIRFDEVAENNG